MRPVMLYKTLSGFWTKITYSKLLNLLFIHCRAKKYLSDRELKEILKEPNFFSNNVQASDDDDSDEEEGVECEDHESDSEKNTICLMTNYSNMRMMIQV